MVGGDGNLERPRVVLAMRAAGSLGGRIILAFLSAAYFSKRSKTRATELQSGHGR
jgi:hypothetical protein